MTGEIRDLLFVALFWLTPMIVVVAMAHFFMSLPARRNERARLFLDLLETGLQQGQSPERTIVSISETRDRSLGVHFHLLAAHIEEGADLNRALERVPAFLPPGLAEVIKIGATESTLSKLLPAARAMLNDANSRLRGALNYVVLFLLVIVPAALFLLPLLSQFIWPKFKQIIADMEITTPAFSALVFENVGFVTIIETIVFSILLFFAFHYIGGPRVLRWTNLFLGGWPDRVLLWMPWRRRRIQRDFTGVLAILLDAGLPECRAVELAARASANEVFEYRAQRVLNRLREGIALPEALKGIERDGEFQWRWLNALRSGQSFFAALRGWHESLEARAFQQEQAAAHVITTSIVLINGALVALITSAVFLVLIAIIEEGILW